LYWARIECDVITTLHLERKASLIPNQITSSPNTHAIGPPCSQDLTLFTTDMKSMKVLYMKCPQQVLNIQRYQHVTNADIMSLTSLSLLAKHTAHPHKAIFSHTSQLAGDIPPHQVHRCHADIGQPQPALKMAAWKPEEQMAG